MKHTLEPGSGYAQERETTAKKVDQLVKFNSNPTWISVKQLEMAMACLELETKAVAEATGLDPQRVEKLVAGHHDPQTLTTLRAFFERAGFVFLLDENGYLGVLYEP